MTAAAEAGSREDDPVLACRALRKSFGSHEAVRGLTFEVRPGEAYGLLGPNGAGKTTTIRMACGILSPDGGSVRVNGVAPDRNRSTDAVRADLGYVPQGLALFPALTLTENLRFWARLYGVPRRERRRRIAETLDAVGLADRAGDRVEQCSGGMQRRLNLAIALVHHPRLLVLDEPTVGVDPQSRASLLDRLDELRREGTAVLYTSHYMEEAQRLCNRVGIIDHGQLLAEGPPDELVADRDDIEDLEGLFLELTGRQLRD
jgi:ABC-2 type transport system ATP-binding protein